MPQEFFRNLFEGTESSAKAQQDKFQKDRDSEINMYMGVVTSPDTDPEQRKKAAEKVSQLRNLDKKDSPIIKLADFLNHVGNHVKSQQKPGNPQPAAQGAAPAGPDSATGLPTSQNGNQLPNPVPQPAAQPGPPPAASNPIKQGFAKKALGVASKGLGGALTIASQVLEGSKPPSLPPLDSSVFPTTGQKGQQAMDQKLKMVDTFVQRGYTKQEAMEMVGVKLPSMSMRLNEGATVLGSDLPEGALDLFGNPIATDGAYKPVFVGGQLTGYQPYAPNQRLATQGNRDYNYNPVTGKLGKEAVGGPKNLGSTSSHDVVAYDSEGNPVINTLGASRTPNTAQPPMSSVPGGTSTGPTLKRRGLPGMSSQSEYMAEENPKGLVEPGNIPIWNRPSVKNSDGTHSSEYSTSFQDEQGREVLVPTVVNGKFLTDDGKKPPEGSAEEKAMFKKAWDHYLKTGENLGKFDNPADADSYAGKLHDRGKRPAGKSPSLPPISSPKSSNGRSTIRGIPAGQFNQFAKGALGATEARAALVGDDPQKPGGLLAKLDVFDDPKSVDALAKYMTAQEAFLERAAGSGTYQGGEGAMKYVFGLPNLIASLKTDQLKDMYEKLPEKAKDYLDAYTRALGAAPGLRALTSASSALGAIAIINQEYPNPQFVNDRQHAEARINNLLGEIYQGGSFNPLLRKKTGSKPTLPGGPRPGKSLDDEIMGIVHGAK